MMIPHCPLPRAPSCPAWKHSALRAWLIDVRVCRQSKSWPASRIVRVAIDAWRIGGPGGAAIGTRTKIFVSDRLIADKFAQKIIKINVVRHSMLQEITDMVVIPGPCHFFEEPDTLDQVVMLTSD